MREQKFKKLVNMFERIKERQSLLTRQEQLIDNSKNNGQSLWDMPYNIQSVFFESIQDHYDSIDYLLNALEQSLNHYNKLVGLAEKRKKEGKIEAIDTSW